MGIFLGTFRTTLLVRVESEEWRVEIGDRRYLHSPLFTL